MKHKFVFHKKTDGNYWGYVTYKGHNIFDVYHFVDPVEHLPGTPDDLPTWEVYASYWLVSRQYSLKELKEDMEKNFDTSRITIVKNRDGSIYFALDTEGLF